MFEVVIKNIKKFLLRPFLMWEHTAARKLMVIIFFVVVSNVFIQIYRPFIFHSMSASDIRLLMVAHSSVTVIVLLFFYFILPLGGHYFKDNHRTFGREIIWAIGILLSAGLGHRIVNNFFNPFSDISFNASLGFTAGISVLPVLVWLFLAIHRMSTENPANQIIELSATSGNHKIRVTLGELLYIQALDNYSEVYSIANDEIKKTVLRVTLNTLLNSQLKSDYLVQIHRSYIANLLNLEKIEINSKASKVYLKNINTPLPLSHARKKGFLDKLNNLSVSYYS